MENIDDFSPECSPKKVSALPSPPPPPAVKSKLPQRRRQSFVSTATRDSWDRMFDEALGADVLIHTDDNGLIYAHSNVIVSFPLNDQFQNSFHKSKTFISRLNKYLFLISSY